MDLDKLIDCCGLELDWLNEDLSGKLPLENYQIVIERKDFQRKDIGSTFCQITLEKERKRSERFEDVILNKVESFELSSTAPGP